MLEGRCAPLQRRGGTPPVVRRTAPSNMRIKLTAKLKSLRLSPFLQLIRRPVRRTLRTEDEMKYAFQTDLNKIGIFYIKQDIFLRVNENYSYLLKYLWFENKYQTFVENYYEFEKTISETYNALKDKTEAKIDIGQEYIVTINRRILNFTSSARNYTDDIDKNVSELFPDPKIHELIKKYKSTIYDNNYSYQLLELLRNIYQHKGFLVRGITIIKPLFGDLDEMPIFANIKVKDIINNANYANKIKDKKMMNSNSNGYLNIIYHIRSYIQSLDEIHQKIRKMQENKYNIAINVLNKILDDIYILKGFKTEVAFIELDDNNEAINWVLVDRNNILKFQKYITRTLEINKHVLKNKCRPFRNFDGLNSENNDIQLNMI